MVENILITYSPFFIALAIILAVYLTEYYKKKTNIEDIGKMPVKIKVSIVTICIIPMILILIINFMPSFMGSAASLSEDETKTLISNEIKNIPEFSGSYMLISVTNASIINKTSDSHFDISKGAIITNDQVYTSFMTNYTINKYTTGNNKVGKGIALLTWDNEKNGWKVEIIEFKAIN